MISSSLQLKLFSEWILICWLAIIFPVNAGNIDDYIYQNQNSQQLQESSINLDVNDLRGSNILKIVNLGNGDLKGEVKLGGKKIRELNSNITEINVSSLLKPGKNILEITGVYSPINSSIEVNFVGSDTVISQETGGSGKLNQRLIIYIK